MAQSFIRKPVCKVKLFACCLVNYYFLGRVLTTVFMMMHKTNRYPASPVLSSCTLSAVFILARKLAVVLIFFFLTIKPTEGREDINTGTMKMQLLSSKFFDYIKQVSV